MFRGQFSIIGFERKTTLAFFKLLGKTHSAMHLLNAVFKDELMIGAASLMVFELISSDPTEFSFFKVAIRFAISISVTR